MGKVIGKEREVCFMDLAYKDYNNHVRPIQEEIKKTEQVIVDLHKQFEETDSSTQRKRISEVLRELNTALPKMRLEQSKMSSKYSVDITLFQLARELDELEKHNATVTSYMEVEQIIIEKLQPIVNKLKEAYSDESALPLSLIQISAPTRQSENSYADFRLTKKHTFQGGIPFSNSHPPTDEKKANLICCPAL